MKKPFSYLILLAVIALLGYKSVYFRKLSEVQASANEKKIDAASYAKKIWKERMPARMDSAVDLPVFIHAVGRDKQTALQKFSNALALGNYRYALVKARGLVTAVNKDDVQMQVAMPDSILHVMVATEYVYGNAIRDASKLVELGDFKSTTDLNNVSEEINKIVRSTVVPEFRQNIHSGDSINIVAAIEINKEHVKWSQLELLPVRIQIIR